MPPSDRSARRLRRFQLERLEPRHLLAVAFQFNYQNDGEIGFNDPVLGTARREALEATAARFGSWFNHSATLEIDVSNSPSSPSGGAAAPEFNDPAVPEHGFYPSVPQQKVLTGFDTNGGAADGRLRINWGGQATQPWELTNDVQPGEVDFTSVVTHELTHLMGFTTGILNLAGADFWNHTSGPVGVWNTFDQFLSNHDGSPLINPTTHAMDMNLWARERTAGTSETSGLFFSGPQAMATNGGRPVPIHTPSPFAPGSSLSHLRIGEAPFDGDHGLMLFTLNDGPIARRWSNVEIAMLRDLGYSILALPTGFSAEITDKQSVVSEKGSTATITVRLDVKPTSPVIMNIIQSDPTELQLDRQQLIFDTHNWQVAQKITVTGINDGISDGSATTSLTFRIDDPISDAAYRPVADQTLEITTTDDGGSLNAWLPITSFVTTPDASSLGSLRFNASQTGTIVGWLDLDRDSAFEDSERIDGGTPIAVTIGTNVIPITIPSNVAPGKTPLRIEFFPTPGASQQSKPSETHQTQIDLIDASDPVPVFAFRSADAILEYSLDGVRLLHGDATRFTASFNKISRIAVRDSSSDAAITFQAFDAPTNGSIVRVAIDGTNAVDVEGTWRVQSTGLSGNQTIRNAESTDTAFELITENDWLNPLNPFDVDGSGVVQPLDALLVINEINGRKQSNTQGALPAPPLTPPLPTAYYDVDGDGKVFPIDALLVINTVNRLGALPSGEPLGTIATSSRNGFKSRREVQRAVEVEQALSFD